MNSEKERQEILDRDASQLRKIKDVAEKTQPGNELQKPVKLPLWTALCSYLVGYLYTAAFFFGFALDRNGQYGYEYGPRRWAQLLFAAVFLVWAGCSVSALAKSNRSAPASETMERRRPSREHFFWMGCILTLTAAYACGRCNATEGWLYTMALHGCAAYWVLCRAGALTEGITSVFFLWDVLDALVITPFVGLLRRFVVIAESVVAGIRTLRKRCGGKLDAKSIGLSLCFIVLALPFLGMAGQLLSQADRTGFAAFWQGLNGLLRLDVPQLPEWVGGVLFRLVVSLPVGAYLYGLVSGGALRDKPRLSPSAVRQQAEQMRVVPLGGAAIVFALFCALYAVFFVFQAGHLFGAFFGVVPGSATAAEYAREGFFQLCQVMLINFGLLGALAKCSRTPLRQNNLLRAAAFVLMGESILLAVTAGSKLWLYIDRFGITPLRLLSSWAVLVLAVGCVLAIGTLCRPFAACRKWIWFAAASFALLCWL